MSVPCWKTISEEDYQKIKHKAGPLLPTMAISTVKYDEHGKPKRAKYRIFALGNLDPHEWEKHNVFSPVMKMLEVRLLTSLAVRHNKKLKSADFKQEFIQETLPDDETYVLRPPLGCPFTPEN